MAPSRARATPAGENAIALMDKRTLAVAASVANVCLGMPKRPEMSRIDQMGENGSRDRTACFRPFLLNNDNKVELSHAHGSVICAPTIDLGHTRAPQTRHYGALSIYRALV